MRHPLVVVALVASSACGAAPPPAPVTMAPRAVASSTSTGDTHGSEPDTLASTASTASTRDASPGTPPTPRPGAGTFGAGVWEPDFRHTGDTHRHRSYLVFDDGRFEYRVDGYDHLPTLACTFREPVAYGGTWQREGNDLVLRVSWEDHVRGGRRVESPQHGCLDDGGSFTRTTLRTPREERVPIGVCAAGFLHPEAPCITLGGIPWYRSSPEGMEPRTAWYAWCETLPLDRRPGICTLRR